MNLFQTIELQDLEMVKALLNAGHDPNIIDASGKTPLMKALEKPPIVELLIQAGADVNISDTDGVPLLTQAVRAEKAGLLQLLHFQNTDQPPLAFEHSSHD